MNNKRLPNVGAFRFHIESYVCDFMGRATIPVFGNFILQAATMHAHQRGFGYDQISSTNCAWVLSRLSIKIDEYPGYDQDLTVETWVEDVSRFFTQRCFSFIDREGKTIGYARSIWAAIDMETRRPIDIPAWRPDLLDYVEQGKECLVEKMAKIPEAHGETAVMGYSIRYSDIDINKHMNSVKYIEHVLNVFDLSTFHEKRIGKFEIIYLSEGTFGDKLKLYRQDLSENETIVDTRKGEVSVCRCRITWI